RARNRRRRDRRERRGGAFRGSSRQEECSLHSGEVVGSIPTIARGRSKDRKRRIGFGRPPCFNPALPHGACRMSTLMRVLFLLAVLAWPGALAAQEFPNQLDRESTRLHSSHSS